MFYEQTLYSLRPSPKTGVLLLLFLELLQILLGGVRENWYHHHHVEYGRYQDVLMHHQYSSEHLVGVWFLQNLSSWG